MQTIMKIYSEEGYQGKISFFSVKFTFCSKFYSGPFTNGNHMPLPKIAKGISSCMF